MLRPGLGDPELGAGAGNSRRCSSPTAGATPVRFDSSLCSRREPAAGWASRAGRPAIGSAMTHVAQPRALIGRTDCLKKPGPGARERPHLFPFSLSAELSAQTCIRRWQGSPKPGAHENLRTSIHLWKQFH